MNEIESLRSKSLRIKWAMFAFFFAQGLCFASWASRVPDIKDFYGVHYAIYWGMILFLIPAGKFIAIPLAGYLVSNYGSRLMVQVSIVGYALSLLTIGLSSQIIMLGIALFCFGVFWNLCDISLNTQAIQIERLFGKSLLAFFHGTWSIAACVGALAGFVMIILKIQPLWHFFGIAVFCLGLVVLGRNYLLEDHEKEPEVKEEHAFKKVDFLLHPESLLLQLGLVGVFALIVESAMFDWSAVYFKSVVNAPESLRLGFLVFMVMMATGRFLTNTAYRLWGKRQVLRLAGMLIFLGFMVTSLLGQSTDDLILKVAINSIGFMMVGLGISCMVPTIYSFVGENSKTPVGLALTILSSISFLGSLIAPLLIGTVTQFFSLSIAYFIIGFLGLCIVLMATYAPAFKQHSKKG
ncbi:MAG: MFS transporter [Massilibacteroides sp.]|nr:MFS transporter [Massilibacteroides sp.]